MKNGLTIKQRMFAKEKIMGKSNTEAARIAGYACPNVQGSQTLVKISNSPEFLSMLDRAGLSEKELFAPLVSALKATKTGTDKGNVIASAEPDHDVRLKAVVLGFKLRGITWKQDKEDKQAIEEQRREEISRMKTEDLLAELSKQFTFITGKPMESHTP